MNFNVLFKFLYGFLTSARLFLKSGFCFNYD